VCDKDPFHKMLGKLFKKFHVLMKICFLAVTKKKPVISLNLGKIILFIPYSPTSPISILILSSSHLNGLQVHSFLDVSKPKFLIDFLFSKSAIFSVDLGLVGLITSTTPIEKFKSLYSFHRLVAQSA
jgi:hypothetical protein